MIRTTAIISLFLSVLSFLTMGEYPSAEIVGTIFLVGGWVIYALAEIIDKLE